MIETVANQDLISHRALFYQDLRMTSEVRTTSFIMFPYDFHDITMGCGITLFLDQDTLAGPFGGFLQNCLTDWKEKVQRLVS